MVELNENWLHDLFIDEAKPALNQNSDSGDSGGINFTTDETLTLGEDGVLKVNVANELSESNTLPVSSQAVNTNLNEMGMYFGLSQTIMNTSALKFDGNIAGRDFLLLAEEESFRYGYVRVSEEVPPAELLQFFYQAGQEGEAAIYVGMMVPIDMLMDIFPTLIEVVEAGIVLADGMIMIMFDDTVTEMGAIKKGVYFMIQEYTLPGIGNIPIMYASHLYIPGYNFPQGSWYTLGDKPFGEIPGGDTLTWDGDITGKTVHKVSETASLCKISNAVPTAEDTINGITISLCDSNTGEIKTTTIPGSELNEWWDDEGLSAEVLTILAQDITLPDGRILSSGVYFMRIEGGLYVSSLTIPGYTGFTSIKKIDAKYLPDGYGSVSLPNAEDGEF